MYYNYKGIFLIVLFLAVDVCVYDSAIHAEVGSEGHIPDGGALKRT
jgi:hypothetical protein